MSILETVIYFLIFLFFNQIPCSYLIQGTFEFFYMCNTLCINKHKCISVNSSQICHLTLLGVALWDAL